MKRKFTLHLDAVLVLLLLFMATLGLTYFQHSQISTLTLENQKLQWQSVADGLNLASQASHIKKIESQLEEAKAL